MSKPTTGEEEGPERPATLHSQRSLRPWLRAVRFLVGKAVLIAITIFVGVFATVLLVNQPSRGGRLPARSPFEIGLEQQINSYLQNQVHTAGSLDRLEAQRLQLRADAGLNLPFWPRHLLWTYKALTFNWGRLTVMNASQIDLQARSTATVRDIVLGYFPNTILLMGSAYLMLFLIGIPLALYLARHHGEGLDRFLAVLSPLSSVPSWVIAVIMIALFAVELRWFPLSSMFDAHKPSAALPYALMILRHMVLPVCSIVISLLFQLVYAWRTFFLIHAEDDFVELAHAKGLRPRVIENEYILRPSLPYVVTSFALSLVAFWQMSMALEVIFRWPGIGWLYINKALPNFWGESAYPGEMIIAVAIVVIFAYLLGIVVFVLDIVYVLVDPRLQAVPADRPTVLALPTVRRRPPKMKTEFNAVRGGPRQPASTSLHTFLTSLRREFASTYPSMRDSMAYLLQHLRGDHGAMFGLTVIVLLIAGSGYALIALPYEKIGKAWDSEILTGSVSVPRLAEPAWTNLLTRTPRLASLVMDEDDANSRRSASPLQQGWVQKETTFTFDFPYSEFPSEVYLYLDPTYGVSRPFVSLTWIQPDGRQQDLKALSLGEETSYDFQRGINVNGLLSQSPELQQWFALDGPGQRPATDLLFAKTGLSMPRPLHGMYKLQVKSLLFEPESDVRARLVLLGQVYGLAGTDYWRRELLVPLLWGMPFTLAFGLFGASITTLLAMLVSAAGVWLGGWVDTLIQRVTEVNMVVPVLAIGALASALLGISLWVIIALIAVLNIFGAPARTFRAAFLQEKQAPYIEAARTYGASDFRIITYYLVPRILPMMIPQLVILVPSFVFLEATLGLFNIHSNYPTWGRIISEGLAKGALYGSRFWVLEPIALVLLTGLAFAMFGSALERALNPRMSGNVSVVLRSPAA